MTRYLAAILAALILMASGCRKDRGRSQREAAPAGAPAASTVYKTVIIPDDTGNQTDNSKSSTTTLLPEVRGPAVSVTIAASTTPAGTTAPTTTAPAAAAPSSLAPRPVPPKTKQTAQSQPSGQFEAKAHAAGVVRRVRTRRVYEDPRLILAGMSYREMVRRFGPATLVATDVVGTSTLSYSSRNHHVQVEVESGRVIAVAEAGLADGP
jgi:hypothetical protein